MVSYVPGTSEVSSSCPGTYRADKPSVSMCLAAEETHMGNPRTPLAAAQNTWDLQTYLSSTIEQTLDFLDVSARKICIE